MMQELKYWIPVVSWFVIMRDGIRLHRERRLKTVTDSDYSTHIDNGKKVIVGNLMLMFIIVIVALIIGQ